MLVAQKWEVNPNITQQQLANWLASEHGITVTRKTISNDLAALTKSHWQKSAEAMQNIRSRLVTEYEEIYNEAMSAWVKSLDDKETITTNGDGEVTNKSEGQSGNPSLLAQARGALQDIEDLLGVESPERRDVRVLNIDLVEVIRDDEDI